MVLITLLWAGLAIIRICAIVMTTDIWKCVYTSHRMLWVSSRRCGCVVTWFCYQLIAKPGNKTAVPSWPNPYCNDHQVVITDTIRGTVYEADINCWVHDPDDGCFNVDPWRHDFGGKFLSVWVWVCGVWLLPYIKAVVPEAGINGRDK